MKKYKLTHRLCDWCGAPKASKPIRLRRQRDGRTLPLALCPGCRTRPERTLWLGHEVADEAADGPTPRMS